MTPSITNAHVCGPLGQALAVVGGETWLYEGQGRRRPTGNEIKLFFQHGLEIRQCDPLSDGGLTEQKLVGILASEERAFEALHGLLAGMDPELTDDLRRRSMRAANRFLTEHDVAQFIERRFLRPLAAQNWDLPGAIDLARAEKLTLAERLYTIVGQTLIQRVEDEIEVWARTRALKSVERAASVDEAYESGLVAAIVAALHDSNPARMREQVFFAKNPKWNRQLATHLVAAFATTKSSSETRRLTRNEEQDDVGASKYDFIVTVRSRISELLDQFRARKRREGRRRRTNFSDGDAYSAALKQVEWIVMQFDAGHPQVGWKGVVDLARQQLDQGDAHKLAMSLTNLSTRLMRHGDAPFVLCDLAAMCAPDDPAVWTARAELLRNFGRLNEALVVYDRAVEDFPQEVYARNGRAEVLRALGRLDEALAAYDRTVEDFPDDAVARNGRAETLRALGRLDEALAAYDRTIEDLPQNVFARNGRAEVLRALGRFDEALAAYHGNVEDFPDDVVARNGRAETLRAVGRLDEALAAYHGNVEDFPDDVVARNGRAETLRALGRFDEALVAYHGNVEDFPDDVVARNGRAETLRALGRFDEALVAYDTAVEGFPHNVVARAGRAETLRALGRFDEALVAYDRTVEQFPRDVVVRTSRAETLRALGRFDEALAAYDTVVEGFPHNAFARTGRAETLRALGRLDEALAAYDRTVEQFPRDVVVRTGRAETLRALGRFDEALAAYDVAVEEFPHDVAARNGRAEALRALGRFDEALAAYERAMRDFPRDAYGRAGYAAVLSDVGRFADARAILVHIERAPQVVSDWIGIHILRMIDLKHGATEALERRLEHHSTVCPFPEQRLYFETALAVVRLALRRTRDARMILGLLDSRPQLAAAERTAVRLMIAHANAADGDLHAARQSLADAANIVSNEEFQLRRIRQELTRRFGLGSTPALTKPEDIAAADKSLIRFEGDFWSERAIRVTRYRQAA